MILQQQVPSVYECARMRTCIAHRQIEREGAQPHPEILSTLKPTFSFTLCPLPQASNLDISGTSYCSPSVGRWQLNPRTSNYLLTNTTKSCVFIL